MANVVSCVIITEFLLFYFDYFKFIEAVELSFLLNVPMKISLDACYG